MNQEAFPANDPHSHPKAMREIKLSGRERVVIRAIGFAVGVTGQELLDATRIEPEQLVDIINAMLSSGLVESVPYAETTSLESYLTTQFETNPSFSNELKQAIGRGRHRDRLR
ncbi:hypothetical protein AYO41_02155 [Verrucomicrobia bacterium SCGC AG-212-E04]|nr:hypothetical protein AYO41_02155 [Verrucomicrobia bacterium SCGC AG-212-E04]